MNEPLRLKRRARRLIDEADPKTFTFPPLVTINEAEQGWLSQACFWLCIGFLFGGIGAVTYAVCEHLHRHG